MGLRQSPLLISSLVPGAAVMETSPGLISHQPRRPRSRAWLSSSRHPATPAPGLARCCLVQGLAVLRDVRLQRGCGHERQEDGASRGSAGFSEPGRDSPQGQGPAAQLKGSLHGHVLGVSQDWPHSLPWGPVQNESTGPFFKNYFESEDGDGRALSHVQAPGGPSPGRQMILAPPRGLRTSTGDRRAWAGAKAEHLWGTWGTCLAKKSNF